MNVIFLDIEGVMISFEREEELFAMDMIAKREEFIKDKDPIYAEIPTTLLIFTAEGWDKEAIMLLRELLDRFDAKIVVSSSWQRLVPQEQLKALFAIHDLDKYLFGMTAGEKEGEKERCEEVKDFLDKHPEIDNFVIFDDNYVEGFKKCFPDNFVQTHNVLDRKNCLDAVMILEG